MPDKPAFLGSKPLFHGTKPVIGCGCCCSAPEWRNLTPSDNSAAYMPANTSGPFNCEVDVRFTEKIELWGSIDNQVTWVLYGETDRGFNPGGPFSFQPGLSVGPASGKGKIWRNNLKLYAMADLDGGVSDQFYFPVGTELWWQLRLSNTCGVTETWTTPRLYRYILKSTVPPIGITCNGCGRGVLKDLYVVSVAGAEGAFTIFQNNSPFAVPHEGLPSTCSWKNDTDFGEDPYTRRREAIVRWVGTRWVLWMFYGASPTGINLCFIQLKGSTSLCQPTGTYTYELCDNSFCPTTPCPQSIVATVT